MFVIAVSFESWGAEDGCHVEVLEIVGGTGPLVWVLWSEGANGWEW